MAKGKVMRERKSIGSYDQFIPRGNPLQDASKVLHIVS